MNRKHVAMALAILLGIVGCVPTLQPLFTEKDLVFEPALIGQWDDAEGKNHWNFEQEGEKAYKLLYVDENGKPGPFAAHLVKLQGKMFLDLYPADNEMKENDFYRFHLVPAHTFMKVDQITPTLKMSLMKQDWLAKYLEQNPNAIRHEKIGEDGKFIVLSAQTAELQAFVAKSADTAEAWTDPMVLTKKSAEQEKK